MSTADSYKNSYSFLVLHRLIDCFMSFLLVTRVTFLHIFYNDCNANMFNAIITVRNSSCGKVMFLHPSVILFTEVGHAWQKRGVWQGACMARGMHGKGDVCGRGACEVGGVCSRGHAWQGTCVAGGVHGGA